MSAMLDVDGEHNYFSLRHATSDARSEPIPAHRPQPRIIPKSQPPSRPPPTRTPPAPVEVMKGVWKENDDLLYSAEYPPVQEYLAQVREAKTLLPAPSDLVLALAALSVVQHTEDIAHWIFWAQSTYWTIGEHVDRIALHRPKLIKTQVPWNGAKEYKLIVNSRQQKFTCVVVQRKWYTTDCTGADAHRRNLRSSGEQSELTPNEFFGIVDNEGPSRRRAAKALIKRTTSSPTKRTRRPPAPAGPPTVAHPVSPVENTQASSQPANRSSTRVRRKVTPSARSPRIVSAAASASSPLAAEPISAPAPATLALPTHTRNRSSSAQSSTSSSAESSATIVARSPSVSSVETTIAPASPRKRKLDEIEEVEEAEDDVVKALDADAAEGMVTRHRASRIRGTDSVEGSQPPSRVGTPVAEPRPKTVRARPRAKRARV